MNKVFKKHNPPKLAQCLLKYISNDDTANTSLGDFEEVYYSIKDTRGIVIAHGWYWLQLFLSFKSFFSGSIFWSLIMFKSYIKTSLRNIKKQKIYSMINITGFAVGIACCMLIYLFVMFELSYDKFNRKADRIFRVERNITSESFGGRWPITSGTYGPALKNEFPEIESFARLWRREYSIKDTRNVFHRQNLIVTDNSLFDIFDYKLENGDQETALSQPNTVVLTRKNALKYLDSEDVIGKTLNIEWDGRNTDFQITGILNEIPANSHIQFDMLVSISSVAEERMNSWNGNFLYTYVLLSENALINDMKEKFKPFLKKYLTPVFGEILGPDKKIEDVVSLELFRLTDIHLHPGSQWEIEPQGSLVSVYIFSSIAVLILIIACINFMNLSTARAYKRAKEVGLRKTVGAFKNQLWAQFLGESLLLACISLIFAVILVLLLIPVFNSIFGDILSKNLLLLPRNIFILICITLISGLLSGLYPAFQLASYDPAVVLKGGTRSARGKSTFRKCMVLIQFIISITLIIGTFTIYRQMDFIQNRSLGFDKENVVTIPVRSSRVSGNIEAFRHLLTGDSRIKSVSTSSNIPGNARFSDTDFRRSDNNEAFYLIYMCTDHEFIDTYNIPLTNGRNFSKDFRTDTTGTFILNESAVRRLGYKMDKVIGKKLRIPNFQINGTIVGVVKDFHFKSLHRQIEPLVLMLAPQFISTVSVRINQGDFLNTIGYIQQKWKKAFPNEEFEYTFLDSQIDLLYRSENKMKNIFIIFAGLSILIACLGLFGLSTFIAGERTKEIGVRKVLGASTAGIVLLLSKEFTRLVILANIVAWPLTWYLMNKWLQNFAYNINIGWLTFILSGVIALVIALVTVIYQAIKAATNNPVDSLKYE